MKLSMRALAVTACGVLALAGCSDTAETTSSLPPEAQAAVDAIGDGSSASPELFGDLVVHETDSFFWAESAPNSSSLIVQMKNGAACPDDIEDQATAVALAEGLTTEFATFGTVCVGP